MEAMNETKKNPHTVPMKTKTLLLDPEGKEIDAWVFDRQKRYSSESLFLPAGETMRPIFARWRRESPPFLKELKLMQVDDVKEGPKSELFAKFFKEEITAAPVLAPHKGGSADLAILGLGTNGHIAFHEPGIPLDFAFGEVSLTAESATRIGATPGTRAITYGIGTFLKSKAILLVVRGESKRKILQEILQPGCKLPGAALLAHPDLALITDLKI